MLELFRAYMIYLTVVNGKKPFFEEYPRIVETDYPFMVKEDYPHVFE